MVKDRESPSEMIWCPTCERRVPPVTARTVSPIGGIVVAVHRCSDCESVLVPQSKPTR